MKFRNYEIINNAQVFQILINKKLNISAHQLQKQIKMWMDLAYPSAKPSICILRDECKTSLNYGFEVYLFNKNVSFDVIKETIKVNFENEYPINNQPSR